MKISDDIQEIIIDLFCNTKLKVTDIIAIIDMQEKLTIEEFYEFLTQYSEKHPEKKIRRLPCDYSSNFDNYIYSLKKEGKTLKEIRLDLLSKHIKIDRIFLTHRLRGIYSSKREKATREKNKADIIKKNGNIKKQGKIVLSEDIREYIYNLKKNGHSYEDITFDLKKVYNIRISYEKIRTMCIEMFNEKNETLPYADSFKTVNKTVLKEIYDLRKDGYSYYAIQSILAQKGSDLSYYKIEKYGRILFKEKNEEEPPIKGSVERIIPDEEIFNLKAKRLSCREIVRRLESENKKVSYNYVVEKCRTYTNKEKRAQENKKIEIASSKMKNADNIKDIMLAVAEKRNASQEELKIFAREVSKMYKARINIDIER